jgi:hypothetical protein
MDEQARKTWSRPELAVLTRGTPEEAVLTACKSGSTMAGSVHALYLGCMGWGIVANCDPNCSSHTSS